MLRPIEQVKSLIKENKEVPSKWKCIEDVLNGSVIEGSMFEALSIYNKTKSRVIVEAALLSTAKLDLIVRDLEIELLTLTDYVTYFFDVSSFTSKLDKLSYVDDIETKSEQMLKSWAITIGYNFVAWRYGSRALDVDVRDALRGLLTNFYFISQEAVFSPITADSTKEAQKWASLSLKAIETLNKIDMSRERQDDVDLAVALTFEETVSEEESLINADGEVDIVRG